ncbi:MAG: ABC transporter ATP-binding protein [Bacteroidetes bacterium]|nr:ABC transporter ATP-binding protein [Bacteroidota bacterium]MCL5025871.1 ABC transporter ATP-binding protein [Chloroflexota bacterium]
MIEVDRITFGYGDGPLFHDFDWSVGAGESWTVIGPSGCGKTTILYLLAALRKPQRGSVRIAGQELRRPRRQTGLILQDYGLLPWASARENVALGLRLRHEPAARREATVTRWLERLGLGEVAGHYPQQLSGGQRQRVAIARTLAVDPDLLLMDEPFSSLDALTREELQDLVVDLGIEGSMTVVLVTHSIEEAVYLGRRILVLPSPPIERAHIVANPEAGSRSFRGQPLFHERCSQVRALVEEMRDARA